MDVLWRIALLGGLRVEGTGRVITRFRTQKTGSLLAYLAYHPGAQTRDTLIERFWPDDNVDAARNSLRVALASLRRQLEPPGVPTGGVLIADRWKVALNPDAVATDIAEFEAALQATARAEEDDRQTNALSRAVSLYQGEMLAGYYDAWIEPERERLREACLDALTRLTVIHAAAGDWTRALDFARRAVALDPLREQPHLHLMRLLAAAGRPADALQQFAELERLLMDALDTVPSAAAFTLAEQVAGGAKAELPPGRKPRPTPRKPKRGEPQEAAPRCDPAPLSGSLPPTFTHFFGREKEIRRVSELLADTSRLITLTGSGGNGKTRLALEAAARARDGETFGAVWFVPLVSLADASLLVGAVADALRLEPSPNADLLDSVVAALSRQRTLLLLDNFEQIAPGGAPVVLTLLKRAPTLTCLVTSRRRLDLPGERVLPVAPLPIPAGPDTPEALFRVPSVALFLDRAQAAQPDFQLTPRNAVEVAALCRFLEGIPLAIELAAARAGVLTPSQIRARLSERLDALTPGRRVGTDTRHRSLRATVEWSFRLLPPHLQRFFAHLSVFRGGWSLEAAEQVCAETSALEYLAQLRAHSLVLADDGAPEIRFHLLETLRRFAAERLAPEEKEALTRKHATFFLSLAEAAEPDRTGTEEKAWLERLDADRDNLRAALDGLHRLGRRGEALRMGAALWRYWRNRGEISEGRARLAQALSETTKDGSVRVKALIGAAVLACSQDDLSAADRLLAESLTLARRIGDRGGVAHSLRQLGFVALSRGDFPAAEDSLNESLCLFQELGERRGMAGALHTQGSVAMKTGDYAAARALYERALALRREEGDAVGAAMTLLALGSAHGSLRNVALAEQYATESLNLYREMGVSWGVGSALRILGGLALLRGDDEKARSLYLEAMALFRPLGERVEQAVIQMRLGTLERRQGRPYAARAHYAEALQVFRDTEDSYYTAAALANLAALAANTGENERAARLFGASEVLWERLGAMPGGPGRHEQKNGVETAVRKALGNEGSAAAIAAGRALTEQEAVAYALGEATGTS